MYFVCILHAWECVLPACLHAALILASRAAVYTVLEQFAKFYSTEP